MTSLAEKRRKQGEKLIEILNQFQGTTVADVNEKTKEDMVIELLDLLQGIPIDVLPYAAISQFVYSNEIQDFSYFIATLEEKIFTVVDDKDENLINKCFKFLEHLELAQQQKDALFTKQEKEIARLNMLNRSFMSRTRRFEKVSNQIEELQESSKNITSNFINILGVFAAILMGAFGAIQSFTSLYENADDLSLGKTFIISSLGASSVVLILFLLLNGIAKLTGRSLSSSKNEKDPMVLKHPTIVIVYGVLVFLSLIGASLELSNVDIQYARQGYWWIIPFAWIIYFNVAFKKQDLFFLFRWKR